MKRVDRLFSIILMMESRSLVRASDLAEHFGVTERTIYRDIASLNEAGVPVVSLPGQGYQMMDGYTLPPLMLTVPEASALLLSARMLGGQAAPSLKEHLRAAVDKLRLVLPPTVRRASDADTDAIYFYGQDETFDPNEASLQQIHAAIRDRHLLDIVYHSRHADETTRRLVEPIELTYYNGAWYLHAYCRLRRDFREFRLSRVQQLIVTTTAFEPRPESPTETGGTIEVRVRFAYSVVPWVHEDPHYAYWFDAETRPDGVVMVFVVDDLQEIRNWVLGFGAAAEVISPQTLRDEIREEARKLLTLLT